MRDHLIIPDDHAYPGDNFRRYEWLGNLIIERAPSVIIKLGDSWDMPSLCHYDLGKKDFMSRSVQEDIEAGHQSEKLIFGPLIEYNKLRTKHKKRKYNPVVVKLIGNHEFRVQRLLEKEPRWSGVLSMDMFKTRLPIDETVVPFMDFTIVDGVSYSHYFVSGVMGRPFSSANAMLSKRAMSCTMGHTHNLDIASLVKPTGERIKGLVAGSYHDPSHSSFAGRQVDNLWWNGILYKHDVHEGDYDLEEISIKRMEHLYG